MDKNGVIQGDEGCDNARPRIRPAWCRVRQQFEFTAPSMTIDSPGNETDVNAIVERFARTGMLPEAKQQGAYADVTDMQGDLTELYNKARQTSLDAQLFAAGWQPAPEQEIQPAPIEAPLEAPPPN